MFALLVVASLFALMFAFFASPTWEPFLIGTAIVMAVLARTAQAAQYHEEIMAIIANGEEQKTEGEKWREGLVDNEPE